MAPSSHSTAQGSVWKPRRSSTAWSSLRSSERIVSRSSGRNTTTRSRRFRNSGRNHSPTARSTAAGAKCASARSKPTPGPDGIDDPTFDVSTKTQ